MPCLHKDLQEASKLHLLEQEHKSQIKIRNTLKKTYFICSTFKKKIKKAQKKYLN